MADRRLFSSMALLVMLMPLGSGLASWFEPAQTSYTESYTVKAGDTSAASGGRLGYPHIHASGSLTVKSCCGFSTNDILFTVGSELSGFRVFGVVAGRFSFEWNT